MFLETFCRDILHSLRATRHNATFALTAALTLALGIGGNTTVFTLVRAVLLRPLDYRWRRHSYSIPIEWDG